MELERDMLVLPAGEVPVIEGESDARRQLLLPADLIVAAQSEAVDRLLTVEEVARNLGVTKRWVQKRARRLPFA